MSVFKRKSPNGTSSEHYYYKFVISGRQYFACTNTPVKIEAEARERLARKAVIDGKWDRLKTQILDYTSAHVTMGKVVEVYKAKAGALPETVRHNINQLRQLVAPSWPGIALEDLTAGQLTDTVVRNFKSNRVAGKSANKVELERAKTTANSIYSQARSVFSREMLAHYKDAGLAINDAQIKAFKTQPLFSIASRQYKRPPVEVLMAILRAAFKGDGDKPPLKVTDPNAYKAFLLALGLGLRKAGASHARYSWITEQRIQPIAELMAGLLESGQPVLPLNPAKSQRVLVVSIAEDFQPKGKDEQSVPMDDFVFSELADLRVTAVAPEPDYIIHGHATERCDLVWRRLAAWMRALGWERRLAAHELRKLFGSEIASAFGIYAAQKLLGHKDANLTSARYADLTSLPNVKIFG